MSGKTYTVKTMAAADYDGLKALWMTIRGFGIRSIDDSREGVERFLKRNMTEEEAACTMSVCGKITGVWVSARLWWYIV